MRDGLSTPGWDTFTTAGFRPRDGLRRWTEWGQRDFAGLTVRPSDPAGFAGEAARLRFGPAVLSVMTFTPAQAVNCLPDEAAPETEDAIVLSLPQRGRFAYACDGGAAVPVARGDIYLRDLTRPWSAATAGDSALITLRLPFADFAARLGDPRALTGRRFDGRRPEVAHLGALLRSAVTMLRAGPSDSRRRILARNVLDALELLAPDREDALEAGRPGAAALPAPSALSLHRRAQLHITRHLADPELSPARVAQALGVSPRALQRAFRPQQTTVQATILEARLARAARQLEDRTAPHRITDLAMSLGFNDMAYFSRTFAARYGTPPSRYRPGA